MKECAERMRLDGRAYPRHCDVCGIGPCINGLGHAESGQEAAVFDALWEVCQDHRVEVGPPHSRYAITGDIVRQMAKAAIAAWALKSRVP